MPRSGDGGSRVKSGYTVNRQELRGNSHSFPRV